jgi:hypothetical protein
VAWVNVFFIPGIFGFLVWELKENWRLYGANRAAGLRPVMIGHHGETMVRLLRPGLHSGTIPKLYAKLRRAERTAHRGGDWRPTRKHREALYLVKKSIHHFVDRELVFLLSRSAQWQPLHLAAGKIELATNCVRVDLACPELAAGDLEVVFAVHAGWLMAGIAEVGWLKALTRSSREAFLMALAGLYKLAGVDLVREQIEAVLGAHARSFKIEEAGLRVRACDGTDVLYDLGEEPLILPRTAEGMVRKHWPVLRPEQILFRKMPLPWRSWVETWESGPEGEDLCHVISAVECRHPC